MIKFIDRDEVYPVYYITAACWGAKEVNMSFPLIERYIRVMKEFDELQEEMEKLWKTGGIK